MIRTICILAPFLFLAACGGDADMADGDAAGGGDAAAADTQTVTVADAGLQTPESVLYDGEADVYLVSNINGAPTATDDNGFISRVQPDGSVAELRWIDGAAGDFTLNAPKGMAVRGDTLFISDIDSVRTFGRTSGEYYGARGVPGATFLNDLAVGPDGTLYVSDSGLNPDFSSSGTDAIYRFDGQEAVAVAEGTDLSGPNGITIGDGELIMVSFGAPQLRRIPLDGGQARGGQGQDGQAQDGQGQGAQGQGEATGTVTLPGGQLDGVVRLDDGSLLVSSWETQSVYRVPSGGGEPQVVVEGIPSPADIGWDSRRQRVLIPVFQENRLVFEPVRMDTEAM